MSDEIISARISDLNAEQLRQVHNMLAKQQEAIVQASQALGRQIDEIKAQRLQMVASIAKLVGDMNFVAHRIAALENTGAVGSDPGLAGRVVGDLLRVDAVAPGAHLVASAKSG